MGRYYTGDIEGKFAFGIQSSDDADFFGSTGTEPNYIQYYFTKECLPDIKEGIATCKKELGEYKKKIDAYFNKHGGWNDAKMATELKITEKKLNELLTWYFRLELGEKIHACVKKQGDCEFDAEV